VGFVDALAGWLSELDLTQFVFNNGDGARGVFGKGSMLSLAPALLAQHSLRVLTLQLDLDALSELVPELAHIINLRELELLQDEDLISDYYHIWTYVL